jgi:hypothetical protein
MAMVLVRDVLTGTAVSESSGCGEWEVIVKF